MIVISILIVLVIAIVKAYYDNENWGDVNHGAGLLWVAVFLIPLCVANISLFPIWLYGLVFNPLINKMREPALPLFYIGNTAFIDKLLRKVFGNIAGESFAFIMFILFITALI